MRGLGANAGANDKIKAGQLARGPTKGFPHGALHAVTRHGIANCLGADGQTEPSPAQLVGSEVHSEAAIDHAATARIDGIEFAGVEESLLTGEALADGNRA